MHISDGVLSAPVLAAGWAITVIFIAIAIWWSKKKGIEVEIIPKLSLMAAVFFVVCLIHIPIGPTCVHFMLAGLMGIILGIFAFPAIFIGLVLQAFLFQFGGITTIGINTVDVGIPALVAYVIFKGGCKSGILSSRKVASAGIFGAVAGGVAVLLVAVFTAVVLIASGEQFFGVAIALVVAHIPVMIIEAVVTGSVVAFLVKVKPELIGSLGGEEK